MKNILIICIVWGTISCGVPQSEMEKIRLENQQLQGKILELQKQLELEKRKQTYPEVRLANTEQHLVSSSVHQQPYTIKVKLPRGYENSSRSYPVLYVTDAETNFGGISYIVQRLIKDELIPPIIIIGIAYDTDYRNFYRLRSRDLTPVEHFNRVHRDPTGGAPKFCEFFVKDLFPFVEENFRVQPEARTLYGHSYGGLFGTYVLLNQPSLFQNYLLLSPSLWFANDLMLDEIKKVTFQFSSTQLYMASGALERGIKENQVKFIAELKARDPKQLTYTAKIFPNETHRTIFGVGFTNGMRYLFRE